MMKVRIKVERFFERDASEGRSYEDSMSLYEQTAWVDEDKFNLLSVINAFNGAIE